MSEIIAHISWHTEAGKVEENNKRGGNIFVRFNLTISPSSIYAFSNFSVMEPEISEYQECKGDRKGYKNSSIIENYNFR